MPMERFDRNVRRAKRGVVYRMARRLEACSLAAAPEQLAVTEGLRAAVAVVSLVVLAIVGGRPLLSWAAFAAFWTCLADPGGADRRRIYVMGAFALAGAIAAFVGTTAGASGPIASGAALLLLVFLAGLSGTYGPAAAQVGTLAAVVAAVAVAFPQPARGALVVSGMFVLGALWAMVLCAGLWPIHPHATVRRSLGAVYLRLADMAEALLALDEPTTSAVTRVVPAAAHRRAVRSAIERARLIILDLTIDRARYRNELETADRLFAVLVAAEHQRALRSLPLTAAERSLLRRFLLLLAEARHQTLRREPQARLMNAEAAALHRDTRTVASAMGRVIAEAAEALVAQSHTWLGGISEEAAREDLVPTARAWLRPVPAPVLHHAARLALAVAASYAMSTALGLNFSYWATMSTVVVVQPAIEATWQRSLERVVGSIAGGLLAALLVAIAPTRLTLLPLIFPIATGAIALRRVNYTLFVVAVTCLFVLVAELLLPAHGIPVARTINSIIGSVVGTAAGLLLWPERLSNHLGLQLSDAVAANLALAREAVASLKADIAFNSARRAAGLASTAAETTCHRLALAGQSRRLHLREAQDLLAELRSLAGAAVAQVLLNPAPDPAGARELANAKAAALNLAQAPALGMRVPLRNDAIGDALRAVAQAVDAYITASNSNPRSAAAGAYHIPGPTRAANPLRRD